MCVMLQHRPEAIHRPASVSGEELAEDVWQWASSFRGHCSAVRWVPDIVHDVVCAVILCGWNVPASVGTKTVVWECDRQCLTLPAD